MTVYIIIAVIAYAIGSINFSILISKKMAGFDIREKGSKNAGSTNMLRVIGKRAALLTLICDILKGIVPVLIAYIVGNITKSTDTVFLIQIAGILVVVGHTFPVFYEFRGGKGVATSLGVLLIINWQIGLICLFFALTIMALSKIVSLGSIGSAILFPVLTLFIRNHYLVNVQGARYFVFSLILAIFVIFNHRENLKRLANGTENKINFKKSM